jgi:hypothetical protein
LALGLKISDKNLAFGQSIELSVQNREDMHSAVEKRPFSYIGYIFETRSGKDRKIGLDRRLRPRISELLRYSKLTGITDNLTLAKHEMRNEP